jgi:hypothetical protein
MATSRPRITVTLTDNTHALLKDLSALSGKSMSFLISDLVDGIIPQLARTVEVMKAAKEAPEEVRQKLIQQYEESEQKILEAAAIVDDQFDLFEAMATAIEKE